MRFYKFQIILFLFCTVYCINVQAQDNYAVVYGKVTNSLGNPLPHAKVEVSGLNNFIEYSDNEGNYKIIIASNNKLHIEFSHSGYQPHKTNSPLLAFQQTYELNIILYKDKSNTKKAED